MLLRLNTFGSFRTPDHAPAWKRAKKDAEADDPDAVTIKSRESVSVWPNKGLLRVRSL
jgi:hypothetical protein